MTVKPAFKPVHQDPKEFYDDTYIDSNTVFRYTRQYINNTSISIHVLHRNNISVPVRNTLRLNYPNGEFIVRTSWTFNGSNIVSDMMKSIKASYENFNLDNEEITLFNKRLLDALGRNQHSPKMTLVLDRVLSARQIKEHGITYLHDEDLVITTEEEANKTVHPYSSEGVTDPSYYEFVTKNQVSGFFIELVDNEQNGTNRFFYTGKRLMEVTAVQDPHRRSGVYYHHATHHALSGAELVKDYCSLEEAELTVGLYKTRDEAATGGNPESVSKLELEVAKREALSANLELERSKHETSMAKEAVERIKVERNDHFEEKKYRRSDEFDNRSTARKDSSEILKLSVALASGALAVFAIMHKNNK